MPDAGQQQDPQQAGAQGGEQGQEHAGQEGAATTFEEWLGAQDEIVRGLYDDHVKGLKGALTSERESRREVEKQLRDLAGKAEKGSESEARLTQMADELAGARMQAEFYEAAHDAGVRNLRLAYLVASQDKLIDARGRVDWEKMRTAYPELFPQQRQPAGNAGSGTGAAGQSRPQNFNDVLRRAAGYQ